MSLCGFQFLRSSCSYELLLCLPLLDLLEACVFVVVVVVFVGDVTVGASVSVVLMLLWVAALLASAGLAGGLCFCFRRFDVLVVVGVVVVFVGDVIMRASDSAVFMLW